MNANDETLARCDMCGFINYLSVVNDHFKKKHPRNQEVERINQDTQEQAISDASHASATESENHAVASGSHCSTEENNSSWNDPQTKLLLDKYEEYMDAVGPLKKFKNKKIMWQYLAKDICNVFGIERSGPQCENRFKTVMKRKKIISNLNETSGETEHTFTFEAEIKKIASKDDNVQPEVLMDLNNIIINKKEKVGNNEKKNKKKSVVDTLWDIHKDKEERKDRRHREKLALLKEIGLSLNKDDTSK